MNISERLKELRQELNLTQRELAKILSISPTCYAGYEQGYRQPDLKTLKKIANFFNVSTDFLLGKEDDFGAIKNSDFCEIYLSSDEKHILNVYRQLSSRDKAFFLRFVNNFNIDIESNPASKKK